MRFASLGSGSEGNGLIVEARDGPGFSRVLLDCGFGLRETERRLERLGLAADELDGIVVTHEHGDHMSGVFRLAKRYSLPVWMTSGTLRAASGESDHRLDIRCCTPDVAFQVGALEVRPFPVPHDALEPVQYVFSDGMHKLGVLTDIGHPTAHVLDVLSGCKALVLECNHDRDLLERSEYPASLKRRIGGDYGHLANDASASLLARLDQSQLAHVVAAHLSRQNNSPDLARAALAGAMGCEDSQIRIADQDTGLDWIHV